MKKAKIILNALILCLCLAACQRSPQNAPIVHQGEGLDIASLSSEENELEDIPDSIYQEYDTNYSGLKICFEAAIEVPNVAECPVVKLAPEQLSDEQINEMIAYFMPGGTLYFEDEQTRAQLEAELLKYKRGMQVGDEYVPYEDIDDLIEMVEKEMLTALDAEELRLFDITQVEQGEEFCCIHFYDDVTTTSVVGARGGNRFDYYYRDDMGVQTELSVMQGGRHTRRTCRDNNRRYRHFKGSGHRAGRPDAGGFGH